MILGVQRISGIGYLNVGCPDQLDRLLLFEGELPAREPRNPSDPAQTAGEGRPGLFHDL